AAFGMLGLETALAVVQQAMVDTGLLDWSSVAEAMSVRPSRIARLEGHGRASEPGEPANLVLYDPSRSQTVRQSDTAALSQHATYAGLQLPGTVVATFLRGRPTVRESDLVGATP